MITGSIVGIGVLIVSDIAAYFFVEEPSYALIFIAIAISVVLKEFLCTVHSQYRSRKFRHPIPGGWAVPFTDVILTLISYLLVAGIFFQLSTALTVIVIVALALEIFTQVATKSWERGMSTGELRTALQETKEMTIELSKED
ncbi:hypothetical protein [Actinobaculum suis]|nr:hypothetical protein [Actinobaculum suis]KMY23569.1 hypothetical protein ACU19_03900 [Actinobaculum suis]MDY5153247.1 hypothetical protein [Actinobaculum suis]